MRSTSLALAAVVSLLEVALAAPTPQNSGSSGQSYTGHTSIEPPNPVDDYYISLGPRPYYLVNNMTAGPLKTKLLSCANGPFQITTFTIGHRGGATLQIPEESVENAMAGARMGAGILECDTSLTADKGLVCRHSLCDLATTTDILLHPNLAAKCAVPFKPANGSTPASATCCTTDITMAEYLTLCSKMDGFNASAKTVQDYQVGAPSFRTELYDTCGQVQTLESYIDLVNSLPGYRNFTPELKSGADDPVTAQYAKFPAGYTQEDYARQFANTFINKGIDPSRVWMQSFNPPDIYLWLKEFPQFGRQAVYLDESGDDPASYAAAVAALPSIKAAGVNIIAPPFNYLIQEAGPDNQSIVPAPYAIAAKAAGLDIITWTFERSGPLDMVKATDQYYYESVLDAVHTDGQVYEVLDILVNQIGIKAIFTDWAATVTYYANCFGLKGPNSADYQPKAGTSGTASSGAMSSASKSSSASSKAPTGAVSQISDGQPQAPTGKVSQISDGQVQAPTGKVSQISDGQVQAPTSKAASSSATGKVTQISDGQPQAPKATSTASTARTVSQISDGQPQATTSHS